MNSSRKRRRGHSAEACWGWIISMDVFIFSQPKCLCQLSIITWNTFSRSNSVTRTGCTQFRKQQQKIKPHSKRENITCRACLETNKLHGCIYGSKATDVVCSNICFKITQTVIYRTSQTCAVKIVVFDQGFVPTERQINQTGAELILTSWGRSRHGQGEWL